MTSARVLIATVVTCAAGTSASADGTCAKTTTVELAPAGLTAKLPDGTLGDLSSAGRVFLKWQIPQDRKDRFELVVGSVPAGDEKNSVDIELQKRSLAADVPKESVTWDFAEKTSDGIRVGYHTKAFYFAQVTRTIAKTRWYCIAGGVTKAQLDCALAACSSLAKK